MPFRPLEELPSPGVNTDHFPPCTVNVALDHVACENTTLWVCARRVQAF